MPLERRQAKKDGTADGDLEDEDSEDSNLISSLLDTSENALDGNAEPVVAAQLQSFRHEWIAELGSKGKKPEGSGAPSSSRSVLKNMANKNVACEKETTFPENFPHTIFGRARKRQDSDSGKEALQDLTEKFTDKLLRRGTYFELNSVTDSCLTIIDLPVELLLTIAKYVVGSELDVRSLEMLSMTSAGFYVLARDHELWFLICRRLFGAFCGSVLSDIDWRQMYVRVPHVYFHGVYIGKCSYIRHGETSFQDQFYRPWHIVVYYRHLRFFADGTVIMVTSSEHPAQTVPYLKSKTTRLNGVVFGHYKFSSQDCLSLELYRNCELSEQARAFRANRGRRQNTFVPHEVAQQEFDIELRFGDGKKRSPHCVLQWMKYDCRIVYLNGETSSSSLDVADKRYFPPLFFSRVKSFAQPDGWDEVLE